MGCATNERFVTIRGGGRIWAVGAIHGEAERLAALHAAIEERFQSGDRIVYLGNYLGLGTQVAATLDELVAFRCALLAVPHMSVCDVAYLRGSQEEMWQKLFQLHLSVEPSSVLQWMLDRGVRQTLAAYGWGADEAHGRVSHGSQEIARWLSELRARMQQYPGHQELLASVRQAAFTDDGALLFVNSGLDPSRPLDTQRDAFWWGGDQLAALTQPYADYKRIIRGFDPSQGGVSLDGYVATVDGGAGFGGTLAAACFDSEGKALDRIDV